MQELPDLTGLTSRQAKFTEGVLSGMGNVEAWQAAGYSQNESPQRQAEHACKLKLNAKIAPILTEFQLRSAAKLAQTADGHSQQLLDLARKSEDAGNYGAAVRAVELTGKVAGLYVDRVAIELAPPVQDALGVMCQEIHDTLGPAQALEYARKKGVEWLPQGDTVVLELEHIETEDEA